MKTILLWDPRFTDRAPIRLLVRDELASAAVRAGVAAAADPRQAGALAAGDPLDATALIEVVVQHGPGEGKLARVVLPVSVAVIGASLGILASFGLPLAGPLPVPAPSFSVLPSIAGTPEVGQTLAAMDGVILNATEVTRRWLLGSALKSTAATWLATSAGNLVLEVTATGPGGSTTKTSAPVEVRASSSPTPTPGTSRSMALGMGVAGFNWFSPNNTWLNHFKPGERVDLYASGAREDANGWPTALGMSNGQPAYPFRIPLEDGTVTPIKYRLITDGDYDFRCDCLADSGGYSKVLVKDGNDWVFTHTGPAAPASSTYFIFTAIRRLATQDIALVRDDEAALYRAGRVFRPVFVADLSTAHHLRFMNWAGANDPVYNDTPVKAMTYGTYDGSDGSKVYQNVPFDIMLKCCQEVGVGGWFNHHHTISDARYADLSIKLDAFAAVFNKPLYEELSNEIWNGGMPAQNIYAHQQAKALGYNSNPFLGALWWAGYRSAQLAKAARGKGRRWVLGGQPSDPDTTPMVFMGLDAAGGSTTDFYALTGTHYSAGSLNQLPSALDASQDAIQQQWVASGNYEAAFDNVLHYTGKASLSVEVVRQINIKNKALATSKGLKLVTYEGNLLHLNKPPALPESYRGFFNTMIAHPLVGPGTTANLVAMQEAGVDEATAFDYDSKPTVTDGGNYGMKYYPSFTAWKQWTLDYVAGSGGGDGGSGSPSPGPASVFASNFNDQANGTTLIALGATGYGADAARIGVRDGHLTFLKGEPVVGRAAAMWPATASHSVAFALEKEQYSDYATLGFVSAIDQDNGVGIAALGDSNGTVYWQLFKLVGGQLTSDPYGYAQTPSGAGPVILTKTAGTVTFAFGGVQYDLTPNNGPFDSAGHSLSTGRGRALGSSADTGPGDEASFRAPNGTNAGVMVRENAGSATIWCDDLTVKSL